MAIDSAFAAAQTVLSEARKNIDKIQSEEDAKLQIITRLLTEALGWSHSDISSERQNENGFSDYEISDGDHKALVIEAKKIGVVQLDTSTTAKNTYKISGPVLRRAIVGIKQAASHCHPLGIQLAVLTDGIKWIVFLPWVRQASYLEKQAVVFPSLDALIDDFYLL